MLPIASRLVRTRMMKNTAGSSSISRFSWAEACLSQIIPGREYEFLLALTELGDL